MTTQPQVAETSSSNDRGGGGGGGSNPREQMKVKGRGEEFVDVDLSDPALRNGSVFARIRESLSRSRDRARERSGARERERERERRVM